MQYTGGKNAVFRHLINQMPPHGVYIESHVGSGPVLRNKRPARLNIGIDLDGEAIGVLAALLPGAIVVSGVAEAVRIAAAIAESGEAAAQFLLVVGCAHEFLRGWRFRGNELVYMDPPYLMGVRSAGRPLYKFEYSDAQHVELLGIAAGLPCRVMVSGYWSGLYDSMLAGWRSCQYSAVNRAGRVVEEWLWMNYPEPPALHDYSFLGNGFRERERIKRKALRWVEGLERLDELERKAIVSRMGERGLLEF